MPVDISSGIPVRLLGCLALLFGSIVATLQAEFHPMHDSLGRPMDIIVLLAVDHGRGDLGVQGQPFVVSPAMDGLAAGGVRLTQFHVTAMNRSASRSGLLSGRIQSRFGMNLLVNESFEPGEGFHHLPPEEFPLSRSFPQVELYDMDTDDNARWNLQEAHHEVLQTLQVKQQELHAEVNGPYWRFANFLDAGMKSAALPR